MRYFSAPLALALLCLMPACNRDGPEENSAEAVRISLLNSPEFTTTQALEGGAALATAATQTSLLSIDASGQLQPGLAQSWRVSNDGRSYIFRLGKATWSDGRAITAGDVVAILRRAVAPGSTHPLKAYLMAIENAPAIARNRKPARMLGVQDIRADILEIRLHAPMPEFLHLLALPAMAIQRKGEPLVASGPYQIRTQSADRLILRANNDKSSAAAAHPPLHLQRSSDAATALQQMQQGQIDMILNGGVDGLSAARTAGPGAQLLIEPSYGLYGYAMRSIDGPLSDVRVRRALNMALDRPTLVARLFSVPALQPTSLPVPPALLEDSQTDIADTMITTAHSARLAEAQALLAEAGYGPSHPLQLDIALPRAQVHRDILAVVAQDWAPLGVELHISVRSDADHARTLTRGSFDLALVQWQSPLALVPMFLEQYRCQKALGGYCNRTADQWLDAGWTSTDLASRNSQWRTAISLYMADVPVIMLFQPVRWHLIAPDISGLQANITGQHPLAAISRKAPRARLSVLKK